MSSSGIQKTPSSGDDEARLTKTRIRVKKVVCLRPGTDPDKNGTWAIPRQQNRVPICNAGLTGEIEYSPCSTHQELQRSVESIMRGAFDLEACEPFHFQFLCVSSADGDKRLQVASTDEVWSYEMLNRCSEQGSLYILPDRSHNLREYKPKLPPATDDGEKVSSAEYKTASSKMKTPCSSRICKTMYSEDQDRDEAYPFKIKSWVRKIVCLRPGTRADHNHTWAIPRKQNRAFLSAARLTGEITYSSHDTHQQLQKAVESVVRGAFDLKASEPFRFQFLSVMPDSDKRLHIASTGEGESSWNCEAVNQCSGQGCLYVLPDSSHELRQLEPRLAVRGKQKRTSHRKSTLSSSGTQSTPPSSSKQNTPRSSGGKQTTPPSTGQQMNLRSSGKRKAPTQPLSDDEARPLKTRKWVKQVVCLRPGTLPDRNNTWAIPRKRNRTLIIAAGLTGEITYTSRSTHQKLQEAVESILRPAFDLADSEPFQFQLLSATSDDARKRLQIARTDGREVRLSSEMINRCSGQGCLYVLPDAQHKLREEWGAPSVMDEVPELCHSRVNSDKGLRIASICQVCHKKLHFQRGLKIYEIVHVNEMHHELVSSGGHRFTVVDEMPLECEVCHETFPDESCLKAHEVTHTSWKVFKCGACHKIFSLAWSLRQHLMTHTLQTSVRCGACGKMLASAFFLKMHRVFDCPNDDFMRDPLCETFSSTLLRRHRLVCGTPGHRLSLAYYRALWSVKRAVKTVVEMRRYRLVCARTQKVSS